MNKPIISVHVPKTAGSSFAIWLETAFGGDQIVRDYADQPIDPKSQMNVDTEGFLSRYKMARKLPEGTHVVHGHFWAKKYERIENAVRITFLREPIDRTISHYFFWLNTPCNGHSLHQRVLDERMGLLDFARLPQIRGFYRNYFFRDIDMAGFDFIGDSSLFDDDLARLETLLSVRGTRASVNQNPDLNYSSKRRIAADQVREELVEILAGEIAFYRQHSRR